MQASMEVIWFRPVCRTIALFPMVLGGGVAMTGTAGFQVLFAVDVGQVSTTLTDTASS